MPDGVVCLHADSALLVLAKPAGLLCVPGRGPDKQDCLSARAQQQWPGALVVHRLDMATSGLVLMARSPDVQRLLGQAFAERTVEKRYQATVQGCMALPTAPMAAPDTDSPWNGWGDITLPISADWERRPLRVVDAQHGKPSHTRWRVLRTDTAAQTTRLELAPVTRQVIEHALASPMADFEDAVLAHAARLAGAQAVITRNERDFQNGPLRVYNPAQWLAA